jgi:endonuclease/exonuclease/phosphatase (EEP) superfamily protein YafD
MQWLFLESNEGKKVVITNLHGLWEQSIKGDTELKLEQSKRIIKVLQYLKTRFASEIIMAGDFNLLPSTESIRMIELFGLRNLITEYGIIDTRTEYYKKELRYADYVFVSSGITVNTFKVLPDIVSDHAPLQLNFSIL